MFSSEEYLKEQYHCLLLRNSCVLLVKAHIFFSRLNFVFISQQT